MIDDDEVDLGNLQRQVIHGTESLGRLKGEGQAILVIDKNVGALINLADRHHIVEKGRVVGQGTPQELDARPEVAQRFLGV